VRRFVFFSSVKACSPPPSAEDQRCDAPFGNAGAWSAASIHDYATSKAMAEHRLREFCRQSPMELVIVRPALVYDVDSPGHLAWLRRWVDLHMPAPPDVGARSMVSREDLVRLAGDLLDLSRPMPAQITATDGEVYSLRRLHAALCEARRRRPWLPSPPPAVWRVFANVFDRLRRIAPGSTWQRLAGRDIHEQHGFDVMGFTPRLNLEACLAGRNDPRP
jgi:nucleoside-diphosphate-sugar epimerase